MKTSFGSVFVERYIQFGGESVLNYSYFIPAFHHQIPTFFLLFSSNYSYFFPTFSSKATFKPVEVEIPISPRVYPVGKPGLGFKP